MALEKFFNQLIEPAALCRNCASYDGGGLTAEGNPVKNYGDCLNQQSPHTRTNVLNTCKQFFPCGKRWPDADHD